MMTGAELRACSDLKVRIFIARSDASVQKWSVGNRTKLGSTSPLPNNASPGRWRVQMVTLLELSP